MPGIPLLDPKAGKPDLQFRTFTMVQQLLGILVLQSVSHPLTWYGFDFIMMCPSYHLTVVSCLWMWSTIFGEFQHPPVNGCLTASCNFGALTGGDEHMGKTVSCFGGRTLLSSVQFSRSVVSDSLRSHESQHSRPPCPSPTPRVHADSYI